MTVQVTEHALAQARRRYGLVNIDAQTIRHDVTDGILAGRASKLHPNGTGYRCHGNAIYVWTPNRERIYIVTGSRSARGKFLRVLTSIPGFYDGEHRGEFRRAA